MELDRLDLFDVDQEREWITIRRGKGGRGRVVPIGERALVWLIKYLEEARPELLVSSDEWAVFLSSTPRSRSRSSEIHRATHPARMTRTRDLREEEGDEREQ